MNGEPKTHPLFELEQERDFYRRQADDLGDRVLRLQEQQGMARREARRARTVAKLVSEAYSVIDESGSEEEIGRRFLEIVIDSTVSGRAAILRRDGDGEPLRVVHALGFPAGEAPGFLDLGDPPQFAFVNASTSMGPQADAIAAAMGVPFILWGFDPRSDCALVLRDQSETGVQLPFDENDEEVILGALGVFTDLNERKQAKDSLRKLSRAVEQSPASVVITDTGGHIEYANPKFLEITGYSLDEVIGRKPNILKSGHTPKADHDDLWQTISSGREWRGEFLNVRKDGRRYWEYASISPIKAADGTITHYIAVKEDISVRKEYEERLFHQANFDPLTGLPNRVLVLDRLNQGLSRARRENDSLAVVFVDLDNFKNVNDTLGHAEGDVLLKQAAQRLTDCVRETDTVSRTGGDEFVIVLPAMHQPSDVEFVARKITEAFAKPFAIGSYDFHVTPSMGIAIYPGDGDDPSILLRNADAAMHLSKRKGRNTFQFFTPEINQHIVERMDLESRLRHALARDDLYLVYQPIIDSRTGGLVSVEALLRWNDEELGAVAPDRFISVAEETGLIVPIGEWVMRTACLQARQWRDEGVDLHRMQVNTSGRQVQGPEFVDIVRGALDDPGLPPGVLDLEITESTLMADVPAAAKTLEELRGLGVKLSIDDFGTGYSSLSQLRAFAVDTLKVDSSFVRDITADLDRTAIAEAIVVMGHSLGLTVTAEGVETEVQFEMLRAWGCDSVQGYLFSMPLVADDLKAFAGFSPGRRARA